jgi:hypothetical protein
MVAGRIFASRCGTCRDLLEAKAEPEGVALAHILRLPASEEDGAVADELGVDTEVVQLLRARRPSDELP